MFQTKEQDKASETDFNEMERSDLFDKELKMIVIKIFIEVRRTMHEPGENFNRNKKYKERPNRNHSVKKYHH